MRIAQFTPYFPPHKWGLETVAEEFSKYFVEGGFGEIVNITFSVGQQQESWEYTKDGYSIIILPAFDIIQNFPVPKIRSRDFRRGIKKIKSYKPDIIQTHTRFFLSTLLWGILAKIRHKKWIHIEHGSEYVEVAAGYKNKIAYIYDRVIGKRVFKKADFLIPISNACKQFIENKFINRENIQVIYRWLEIPKELPDVEDLHKKFPDKYIIWFIWRLYKWKNIETLISSYYRTDKKLQNKIQIVVVGDGEDLERLQKLDKYNKVYFTWGKPFAEALAYQKQFDIHYHTSNPGGWLATTLLQAMYFGCFIVATPNEWALDVLKDWENAIVLQNSSMNEIQRGIETIFENYKRKEERAKINKKIIEDKFQWEKNIYKYVSVYERT